MYEIELKARVKNKEETTHIINSFATQKNHITRHDVYWILNINSQPPVIVRIREEITENENITKQIFVTYKRKKLQFDTTNKAIEVNEEFECIIHNRKSFETILEDSGYSKYLSKNKTVDSWKYGKANIELCTIDTLGDFLEIEILSKKNDEKTVLMHRKELLHILTKSGLHHNDIENRYYSEMLKNIKKEQKNV
ncbi:MAG TPA: class IV adenylate cyclase [Treponemataceae bacterium]|nr:class IV adenylate cyclase [Treponemataceae bacterium]